MHASATRIPAETPRRVASRAAFALSHSRSATAEPGDVLQRCACGGGCPRCRAAAGHPALAINTPGDAYEREADRIADAVVSGAPAPASVRGLSPALQRCACGGSCPACRAQADGNEELHRDEAGGARGAAYAPPGVHEVLASSGRPLDRVTRGFMESRFGTDFGGVRVHTDVQAAESEMAVGARAYAVGQDLGFAAGTYEPGTLGGKRLIAHELAHVVQQQGAPLHRGHARAPGEGVSDAAPGRVRLLRQRGGTLMEPRTGGNPDQRSLFDDVFPLRHMPRPWLPLPPLPIPLPPIFPGGGRGVNCDLETLIKVAGYAFWRRRYLRTRTWAAMGDPGLFETMGSPALISGRTDPRNADIIANAGFQN